MNDSESLVSHLDRVYAGCSHSRPTRKSFRTWQIRKRKELTRVLAVPKISVVRTTRGDSHRLKEGVLETIFCHMNDGTIMRTYIGMPRGVVCPKIVVIYHGHADGAQTLFGIALTKWHQDYALEYMRKGYAVVAPDLRGFGKRLGPAPIHYNGYTRSCRQLSFDLMMMGRTLLGDRVADGMALVRFVKKIKNIDTTRIVITGNSGGGTVALFQAALDARVDAALIGSALSEYKESIMNISHCECNYVPNILSQVGEMSDIASLAAPTPLFIIHGKKDAIYPVSATKKAFAELKRMYTLAGATRAVQLALHTGEHRYDHARVFSFLTNVWT